MTTYRDLHTHFPTLTLFAKRPLKRDSAMAVARAMLKLRRKYLDIDREQRNLIDEFSEKDEDGKQKVRIVNGERQVSLTDPEEYQTRMDAMLDTEVEHYPQMGQVKLNQLPKDTTALEIEALLALGLVDEEEE